MNSEIPLQNLNPPNKQASQENILLRICSKLGKTPADLEDGVKWDAKGRIVEINWSNKRLGGKIPSDIFQLDKLLELRLENNSFIGSIPEQIRNLSRISILHLNNNQLSGSIPSAFGVLTSLTELYLHNNLLSGSVPKFLWKIGLVHLCIVNNYFSEDEDDTFPVQKYLLNADTISTTDGAFESSLSTYTRCCAIFGPEAYLISIPSDLNNWHENTLVWLDFPFLLPSMERPLSAFNPKRLQLFSSLKESFRNNHRFCLLNLLKLWISFTEAAKHHPLYVDDLKEGASSLETVFINAMDSDSLDFSYLLQELLLPSSNYSDSSNKAQADLINHWLHSHTLVGTGYLRICIDYDAKFVFNASQITNLVDNLFWRNIQPSRNSLMNIIAGSDYSSIPSTKRNTQNSDADSGTDSKNRVDKPKSPLVIYFQQVQAILWNPRACPAALFIIEGLFRLVLLGVVTAVSMETSLLADGQLSSNLGIWVTSVQVDYKPVLIAFFCTCILHEIGQVVEAGSLFRHFQNPWNTLDACSYALLSIWAGYTIKDMKDPYREQISHCCLAISAIPLALGLLQYFSAIKSFGQLVIMMIALLYDVVQFIVIFAFCTLGFGITLRTLYFGEEVKVQFGDFATTFLTLFSALMGSFEFIPFGESPSMSSTGAVVLIVYITFMGIMLMNLLIARMSGTHDRIEAKATQEWSYRQAVLVTDHMITIDRNVLCMLPAPFNIIPIVLWPLQKFIVPLALCHQFCFRSTKMISLPDTASDAIIRLIFAVPRAICTLIQWSNIIVSSLCRIYSPTWISFIFLIIFSVPLLMLAGMTLLFIFFTAMIMEHIDPIYQMFLGPTMLAFDPISKCYWVDFGNAFFERWLESRRKAADSVDPDETEGDDASNHENNNDQLPSVDGLYGPGTPQSPRLSYASPLLANGEFMKSSSSSSSSPSAFKGVTTVACPPAYSSLPIDSPVVNRMQQYLGDRNGNGIFGVGGTEESSGGNNVGSFLNGNHSDLESKDGSLTPNTKQALNNLNLSGAVTSYMNNSIVSNNNSSVSQRGTGQKERYFTRLDTEGIFDGIITNNKVGGDIDDLALQISALRADVSTIRGELSFLSRSIDSRVESVETIVDSTHPKLHAVGENIESKIRENFSNHSSDIARMEEKVELVFQAFEEKVDEQNSKIDRILQLLQQMASSQSTPLKKDRQQRGDTSSSFDRSSK